MWTYLTLLITRIKCASDVLLYHQFSFSTRRLHNILETGPEGLIQITRFKHDKEEFRVNVCAVCLGEVEEGEEIRELRCSHVFHQLCLERWIRFKHTTCPLCHGSLAPPLSAVAGEQAGFGVEVVFFKFCSFGSNIDDVRDTWWLR